MSFDLTIIAIFIGLAFIYAALMRPTWRRWFLLATSVVTLFWLQPRLPVRFGGFLLPLFLLLLTIALWFWFVRDKDRAVSTADWAGAAFVIGIVLLIDQTRYLALPISVYAVRPPGILPLLIGLTAAASLILGLGWLTRESTSRNALTAGILFVALLFILWKSEPLATGISRLWRGWAGQDQSLAAAVDLGWLGFSYVAFRLIHSLREKQLGNLPVLDLVDYVTYVLFFAALPAGPIDRAERFQSDLMALPDLNAWAAPRFQKGFERIVSGMIKKFLLADSLALGLSLNPVNAAQVDSTAGLWLLLYGYALRLYFDFSGYSDIAIGLGLLFGITLPENFDWPYVQTNLTAFWQRWHMSLSNWVRHYVFTPLSRALLRRDPRPPTMVIVLIAQLTTMIVIGLWHGISWNFLIWGVWHGVGLFIHKQWSDRTRRWYRNLQKQLWPRRLWFALTWLITFHYVVIGWIWFVIPDTELALRTVGRLFGLEVLP